MYNYYLLHYNIACLYVIIFDAFRNVDTTYIINFLLSSLSLFSLLNYKSDIYRHCVNKPWNFSRRFFDNPLLDGINVIKKDLYLNYCRIPIPIVCPFTRYTTLLVEVNYLKTQTNFRTRERYNYETVSYRWWLQQRLRFYSIRFRLTKWTHYRNGNATHSRHYCVRCNSKLVENLQNSPTSFTSTSNLPSETSEH